jgi:hypothetical protein
MLRNLKCGVGRCKYVTCNVGINFTMVHFFKELYSFIHIPYSQAYFICVAVPAVLAAASAADSVAFSCRYACYKTCASTQLVRKNV